MLGQGGSVMQLSGVTHTPVGNPSMIWASTSMFMSPGNIRNNTGWKEKRQVAQPGQSRLATSCHRGLWTGSSGTEESCRGRGHGHRSGINVVSCPGGLTMFVYRK